MVRGIILLPLLIPFLRKGECMSLESVPMHVLDKIIDEVYLDFEFSKMTYPVGKPIRDIAAGWPEERIAVVSVTETNIEIAVNPTINLPYQVKTLEYAIVKKVRDLYVTDKMRGVFSVHVKEPEPLV